MWTFDELARYTKTIQWHFADGSWGPLMPLTESKKYKSLKDRFLDAWKVFQCRAVAVDLPQEGETKPSPPSFRDDTSKALAEAIEQAQKTSYNRFSEATTVAELEAARVSILGKDGSITSLLKRLGQVNAKDRPKLGDQINALRKYVDSIYRIRKWVILP